MWIGKCNPPIFVDQLRWEVKSEFLVVSSTNRLDVQSYGKSPLSISLYGSVGKLALWSVLEGIFKELQIA